MKKTLVTFLTFAFIGVNVSNASLPASPKSLGSNTKNQEVVSNSSKEKIDLAITEGLEVNGSRPVTVKIYDKELLDEIKKQTKGKIDTSNLVIKGVASQKDLEGNKALSIQWNQVANYDESKTSNIYMPLESLLSSPDGKIPPATKFPAYGDKEEIKRAILQLADAESKTSEEKKLEEEKSEKSVSDSGFSPRTSGGSSTGDSGTDGFSGQGVDFNKASDVTTYKTTNEGCTPRIDWVSEKVYPTLQKIKVTNGVEEKEGECTDSGIPYDIKYDYLGCEDKIVLETKTATPYKKAYYVNASGEVAELKSCYPDEKLTYQVEEEAGFCKDVVDIKKKNVTEALTLVYRNRNNARIVVDQCTTTENSRVFDLKETICGYIPDYDNNSAKIKTVMNYEKDGQTINVTSCLENEKTQALKWDTASCKSSIDFEKMSFVEMGRPMITTTEGNDEYIGNCVAMPSNTNNVLVAFEGCEALHNDYLTDGYSTAYARYYQDVNGSKKYLTECVEYPKKQIKHKSEVVSYLHEDSNYRSFAQYRTYIELPYPTGKIFITPVETDTTTSLPYVTKSTKNVPIEKNPYKYEGCIKYQRMMKAKTFERADKSEYYLEIEETEPEIMGDVCVNKGTTVAKNITETLSLHTTHTRWLGQKICRFDCMFKDAARYIDNDYYYYDCYSYKSLQEATETVARYNPETQKTFNVQGLTTYSTLPCKGKGVPTYCNKTSWSGESDVSCKID